MLRALTLAFLFSSPLVCLSAEPAALQTEANAVARSVIANKRWMSEAQLCPAQFVGAKESLDHLVENTCKPGHLHACLEECTAGKAGACYWLANALQMAKADDAAAEALYQQSCKMGVMSGCTNRAADVLHAAGEDASAKACAATTFAAVCAFDDPWACTMNALVLTHGIGTQKDTARALKSLEKSCKYGPQDPACQSAADIRNDIRAAEGEQH